MNYNNLQQFLASLAGWAKSPANRSVSYWYSKSYLKYMEVHVARVPEILLNAV